MMFRIVFNVLNWACDPLNIVAHLTAENLDLRKQLLVLKRDQKRPSIKSWDRLFHMGNVGYLHSGIGCPKKATLSLMSDYRTLHSHGFNTQAAVDLGDELRAIIWRLAPSLGLVHPDATAKHLAGKIYPLTPEHVLTQLPELITIRRRVNGSFAFCFVFSVVLVVISGDPMNVYPATMRYHGIVDAAIVAGGWRLMRTYERKMVAETVSRAIGQYSESSGLFFVNPNLNRRTLRQTLAHELSHHFFPMESHLREALGELRAIEWGIASAPMDPYPTEPAPLSRGALSRLAQWCKTRYGDPESAETSNHEPLWTYHYATYVAHRVHLTAQSNFAVAYPLLVRVACWSAKRSAK